MAVVNRIPALLDASADLAAAKSAAPGWLKQNSAWLAKLLKDHQALLRDQKVELHQATYDGELEEIELRDKSRGDDVNHKVFASLAQLIVDTPVDYMLGKPIVWAFKDPKEAGTTEAVMDEYRKELLSLLETEDAQRVLRETLTQGGIGGMSFILCWVDENGGIDYEEFPIQEVVPVYDGRGRLKLVVRFYQVNVAAPDSEDEDLRYKAEIYDSKYVTYATGDEDGEAFDLDKDEAPNVIDHKAGRIPVSVFLNGTPASYMTRQKKAGVSDLAGGVLSMLLEFAHGLSDKANAIDRMQDQLLLMTGVQMGATQKEGEAEVMAMRKARALALKNKESTAQFIQPGQEDKAIENFLDRLRDTIHSVAYIPKLDDLSGATATEIKVKYAGLDIKAGKKETYFRSTIKTLLAVLTDFLNARKLTSASGKLPDDYQAKLKDPAGNGLYSSEWVEFTLNRNMPQNFLEVAQIVQALADKVPDSYLYELLWFIPDPQAALDEMKKQKDDASKRAQDASLALLGMGAGFGSTASTKTDDQEEEQEE
jgi:SPP1 family phage portal protein